MSVWGCVISQLQPNLPDTPPVTVCLQCSNDRFYSPARWVLIHNHQLIDLGRAQAHSALKNILHYRENLMILEPQVLANVLNAKNHKDDNEYKHRRTSSQLMVSQLETNCGLPQWW
jgi:hypothetical protein